jgi:hypothetical protein
MKAYRGSGGKYPHFCCVCVQEEFIPLEAEVGSVSHVPVRYYAVMQSGCLATDGQIPTMCSAKCRFTCGDNENFCLAPVLS